MPDDVKDTLVGILLGDSFVRKIVYLGLCSFLFVPFLLDINVSLEENNILALSSILVWIPVLTLTPVLGLTPILGLTFASSYSDPESEKASILRENRGKSGIYMWKNKVNGKTYVGSSVDLTKRLRNYFNTSYLSDLKHIMLIYKALLAHGFANFRLEILEYCKPSLLIKREQYYIDLLKPEYNILKIAGSRLGIKHSEEVKAKIKAGALGRSEEVLAKNREHLKILNASQKQKDHLAKLNASLEHIAIHAKPVVVINTDNGESVEYRSMSQAAKNFNLHTETIRRCIKANKLLLNKYQIIRKT